MNYDEVDMYTRERRYGPAVEPPGTPEIEDKDEEDFILIKNI